MPFVSAQYEDSREKTILATTDTGRVIRITDAPDNALRAKLEADGVQPDSAPTQPAAAPSSVTMRQLLLGLMRDGWITAAEAEAWAERNALPAAVEGVIAAMPEADRTAARVTAYTMTEARRADPLLVGAARAAMPEATDAEIAATLEAAFATWSTL